MNRPSFYPKHLAKQAAAATSAATAGTGSDNVQRGRPEGGGQVQHHQPPVGHHQRSVGQQQQQPHSTVFEGLPGPFIEAMRKLFDLVDVRKEGRVRVDDIASKWAPAPPHTNHLPKGIVASLKKVTTPDGFLTFERFCAGLKIAMLRHDAEVKKHHHQNVSMVSR